MDPVFFLFSICFVVGAVPADVPAGNTVTADVVVYGANAGGVLASVAAARGGASVALLCEQWPDCFPPSLRIGGLTTGGLSFTDSCRQSDSEQTDPCQLSITGGLSKAFFNRSASTYGNWPNTLSGPNMPYNNEPHVALRVLHELLAEESQNLSLHYSAEVSRVVKSNSNAAITSITLSDGRVFNGKTFVDSSYTGDLMAAAGVDYTVGREANTTYNESMAGRNPPP